MIPKKNNSSAAIQKHGIDSLNVKPGKELSNEIIGVKLYNIIIPDHRSFVAVEWLRIPDNESAMEVYLSQADILKH